THLLLYVGQLNRTIPLLDVVKRLVQCGDGRSRRVLVFRNRLRDCSYGCTVTVSSGGGAGETAEDVDLFRARGLGVGRDPDVLAVDEQYLVLAVVLRGPRGERPRLDRARRRVGADRPVQRGRLRDEDVLLPLDGGVGRWVALT